MAVSYRTLWNARLRSFIAEASVVRFGLIQVPVLISLATPHAALADGYDKYRIKCSSSELTALSDAVAKAKDLASGASAELPPKESTGGARFKKWFGGPEGDYDAVVKTVYDEMALNLIFQNFWCLPPNS